MKKYVKIGIILIIVISLIIPFTISIANTDSIVNAEVEKLDESQFLSVSSNQITLEDKIELILDISAITYSDFTLTLSSENLDLSSLKITSDTEIDEVKEMEDEAVVDDSDNTVSITISNSTLNQIVIQIDLPENAKVGDNYEIVGTVVSCEAEEIEETVVEEITTEDETEETEDSANETEDVEEDEIADVETENIEETKTDEVEETEAQNDDETEAQNDDETEALENIVKIEIVESSEIENNFQNEETDDNSNDTSNFSNNSSEFSSQETTNNENDSNSDMSSIKETTSVSSSISSSSGTSSISLGSNVATVTYNGSDNCYLSELSVTSYDLNSTFSKDKTTYFATVGSDVDSLEINATAEDDEATVCIYGDSSLNSGTNKILITVTAENGNTRTYKIIVTKES